jgi:hypothetical protein
LGGLVVRVTVYADSLEDAQRALRAIRQHVEKDPTPTPRKYNGALWSSADPAEDWHALVWGTPEHMRADCRRQPKEDTE